MLPLTKMLKVSDTILYSPPRHSLIAQEKEAKETEAKRLLGHILEAGRMWTEKLWSLKPSDWGL